METRIWKWKGSDPDFSNPHFLGEQLEANRRRRLVEAWGYLQLGTFQPDSPSVQHQLFCRNGGALGLKISRGPRRHWLCLSVFPWWELVRQEAEVRSPWGAYAWKLSPGWCEHLSELGIKTEEQPSVPSCQDTTLSCLPQLSPEEKKSVMCIYICRSMCLDVHINLNCMVLKLQKICMCLVFPPGCKGKDLKNNFKVVVIARKKNRPNENKS